MLQKLGSFPLVWQLSTTAAFFCPESGRLRQSWPRLLAGDLEGSVSRVLFHVQHPLRVQPQHRAPNALRAETAQENEGKALWNKALRSQTLASKACSEARVRSAQLQGAIPRSRTTAVNQKSAEPFPMRRRATAARRPFRRCGGSAAGPGMGADSRLHLQQMEGISKERSLQTGWAKGEV